MTPTSNREIQPKLPAHGYFFWRYDLFPYLLGGEGDRIPSGLVAIPSYGNATFKPVYAFKSISKGKAFHKKLKKIEADRRAMFDVIRAATTTMLDVALREVDDARVRIE